MKRIRHAAHEFVEHRFVERHASKGWLKRDFNIAGRWYLWRKNIEMPTGIYRFGVFDRNGFYERETA